MKRITILLFIVTVSLISCKNDEKENVPTDNKTDYTVIKLSPKRPNLNVSILLDLSDRINPDKYPNPSMEYYERDLGYINSIAQAFEIHLRNKRSITINDNIQLFLDPEPLDKSLNEKIKILKMSFTRNNATKESILRTSIEYDSITKLIYESAIKDNNYVGSDTWKFFKNKVKDYCIDNNSRNILVLLTDGYIYHKDTKRKEQNRTTYLTPQSIRNSKLNNKKWEERFTEKDYGFIPATTNLSNLEVLVLGINPDKKNQYEEDVIKKYWSEWLDKMGVIKYEIKLTDLPTNMDKLIKNYIFNEQ